jgi:hypothetical protein
VDNKKCFDTVDARYKHEDILANFVGKQWLQTIYIFSLIAFGIDLSLCLFPNGNRKQMRNEWHLMCTDGGLACKFLQI